MKNGFIIAAVIAVIGIYLITLGASDTEHVSLLGLTFHPSVARGVGIFGIIVEPCRRLGRVWQLAPAQSRRTAPPLACG